MIDIARETLLSLPEAANRIPSSRKGKPTNPATIWRLIQSRKLEGIRLGSRWLTSVEALQRYADAETERVLNAEPSTTGQMSPPRRRKLRQSKESG